MWCRHGRVHVGIRSSGRSCTCCGGLLFVLIPVFAIGLVFTSPHAHITSDTNTTTLLGNHTAQRRALAQAWELLGTEDMERLRLDFQTVRHVLAFPCGIGLGDLIGFVMVFGLLQFLVEAEAEAIPTLVPNGKIWEDEVAGGRGTVQVNHACDGSTGQDWGSLPFLGNATVGHGAGRFQSGEEKVIGVHGKSNVLFSFLALEDLEFDDGRRIHGTAVCRSCRKGMS